MKKSLAIMAAVCGLAAFSSAAEAKVKARAKVAQVNSLGSFSALSLNDMSSLEVEGASCDATIGKAVIYHSNGYYEGTQGLMIFNGERYILHTNNDKNFIYSSFNEDGGVYLEIEKIRDISSNEGSSSILGKIVIHGLTGPSWENRTVRWTCYYN